MSFVPQKMFDSIDSGTYQGVINDIYFSNDGKNCWFKILIDGIDKGIFNTMFTVIDITFNNFAINFVDEDGYFCPDKLINHKIEFEVNDRVYNDKKISKITTINVISNKE